MLCVFRKWSIRKKDYDEYTHWGELYQRRQRLNVWPPDMTFLIPLSVRRGECGTDTDDGAIHPDEGNGNKKTQRKVYRECPSRTLEKNASWNVYEPLDKRVWN